MKLCILGSGITSLSLAQFLVNQGISVDLFSETKKMAKDKTRTIGISKKNLDFFNKNILDIKKFVWNIKEIDIFSDNLPNEKILNFKNKNQSLFSIIKNYKLYEMLLLKLKKNKLFKNKIKKNFYIKDYNLIINCDVNNNFAKKFFFKKLKKNYNSFGHTAIIKHKKIKDNYVASQIFTKKGPLAFLPISSQETSVVYSIKGGQKVDIKNLINKYNIRYSIKSFSEFGIAQLKSSNLRNYYYKNILAFGDLLHRLHPLAGQGFNMNLRDIKILSQIIKYKLDHGLELDSSICVDFENKTKHKNYLFTSGIDSIYEFFNLESKMKNKFLSKSVKFFGQNKLLNKTFEKIANSGFVI
tara:strand:+ start:3880 stop:4944 length:1065 start_codon:yes stop_codon:yes gene_type:complete